MTDFDRLCIAPCSRSIVGAQTHRFPLSELEFGMIHPRKRSFPSIRLPFRTFQPKHQPILNDPSRNAQSRISSHLHTSQMSSREPERTKRAGPIPRWVVTEDASEEEVGERTVRKRRWGICRRV